MHVQQRRGFQDQNAVLTLGDVVAVVSAIAADEREIAAVVLHILRRESIRFPCAASSARCGTRMNR